MSQNTPFSSDPLSHGGRRRRPTLAWLWGVIVVVGIAAGVGGARLIEMKRQSPTKPAAKEQAASPAVDAERAMVLYAREGKGKQTHLVLADPVSAVLYEVTPSSRRYSDQCPEVSPDGSKIAFLRTEDENAEAGELYLVDIDGHNLIRICDCAGLPKFSPDGRTLYFITNIHSEFAVGDLASVAVDDPRTVRTLTHDEVVVDYVITRDPQTIVYVTELEGDLKMADIDGKHLRPAKNVPKGECYSPCLAPDGRTVIFLRRLYDKEKDIVLSTTLYAYDTVTQRLQQLYKKDKGVIYSQTMSPDGQQLLMAMGKWSADYPITDIVSMKRDGSHVEPLLPAYGDHETYRLPAVNWEEKRIAFVYTAFPNDRAHRKDTVCVSGLQRDAPNQIVLGRGATPRWVRVRRQTLTALLPAREDVTWMTTKEIAALGCEKFVARYLRVNANDSEAGIDEAHIAYGRCRHFETAREMRQLTPEAQQRLQAVFAAYEAWVSSFAVTSEALGGGGNIVGHWQERDMGVREDLFAHMVSSYASSSPASKDCAAQWQAFEHSLDTVQQEADERLSDEKYWRKVFNDAYPRLRKDTKALRRAVSALPERPASLLLDCMKKILSDDGVGILP